MTDQEKEALFKEHYEFFRSLIRKRRDRWMATSIMEFEDLESILLTRLYRKIHLYDPARPLDRWANTVISREIMRTLRDNIYKTARPCVSGVVPGSPHSSYGSGCVHNLGGTCCALTKSGQQDSTCPLYKLWVERREAKHSIKTPLSLEAHTDEHHSRQCDFVDIESQKTVIDAIMVKRLSKADARLYRLLYIKHYSIPKVMKMVGLKTTKGHNTPLQITKARNRFIRMFKSIMAELDL